MVIQIRVDDRLIHGQVALVWSKELNTPGIVVVNDNAVTSDVLRMTLQMAVPAGKKLLVKSVKDSIDVFNNPKGKDMRMFALTNTVKDAYELVKHCPGNIQAVNIANVGRFDGIPMSDKISIADGTIYLTPDDLEAAKQLCQTNGVEVFHQLIPAHTKVSIEKELKEKNLL